MLCANEPTPRIITLAADFLFGVLRSIIDVGIVPQIRLPRNAKSFTVSTSGGGVAK
jgi:hypothetical protein